MNSVLKKRKLFPSIFECVFSIPKTIYFNFKVLPFKKAIKLPFFVSCYTKLSGVNKKTFICEFDTVKTFMSRIGIAGSGNGYVSTKRSVIFIRPGGKIIVKGIVAFSRNIYIEAKGGTIVFGNNIRTNVNCHISSELSTIYIGENCVFGWNCTVKNCDGHFILENNDKKINNIDVNIGDHCWICSNSSILKGGYLGDNCVLAYGSILTNKISEKPNVLYGGYPAKIIKENINWAE